ncbi:hypothetical protein VCSRO19_0644 [Vibrio cholerae]|nr:BREX-1 system adenine-specific DNA-methyltransferase PglX [Vibrio cholerae]GIB72263.1 hypothetical protein VCSRO19_0644 [Vibrio cholerae]HDG1635303.1 BREX-1 system adenine-specific DNA-methyltransferase PglX [Vibrio cholerae]
MAFDQSTRNRLQKFVSNARAILGEEFTRQLQATYGLDPKQGTVAAIDSLTHLDNRQRQTAHLLRETLAHYLATSPGKGEKDRTKQVLDRIVREQAFTVLNRLAALRMAEARGFLLESIAKAHSSKGFQLYRQLSGTAHGETGDAYRNYLFSLFDEFSLDLAVLFDRHSAQGRLFPRESALLELLAEINHVDIEHLWAEDETIGWIYQYFNSQEERKKMRAESQAPRNSRELAVRNQFFTPRYVVEFLTDNTLGRIWYEMTQGNTALVDSCRYLVRRPTEIFLKLGETAPETGASDNEALSQEELLKQPVYIPHRPLKDPRSIRMLDPACGSMHFGLYAFDLFERIYLEAWQLEQQLGPDGFTREASQQALQSTYESLEAFKQQIPKLIIEHNIHGVDIDPRAVQIAGLSLWQRAQRAWHLQGIKPQQRPTIVKSNIVCAEPMPGEKALLQEFTSKLNPPVLGQLLEKIFDLMQLAGEAGTLLKIEEEIQTAIHEAREQWLKQSGSNSVGDMFQAELDAATPQTKLGFDLRGIDDETFWDDAEQRILQALSDYADQAESDADQKRLFAEDAAKGFAFIDLCRKRFDVVLMNPPFGDFTLNTEKTLSSSFPDTNKNILCAFIARAYNLGTLNSLTGLIYDKTAQIKSTYEKFRRRYIFPDNRLESHIDLGWGILDANVEVASSVLRNNDNGGNLALIIDVRESSLDQKWQGIESSVINTSDGVIDNCSILLRPFLFNDYPNAVLGHDFPEFARRAFERLPQLSTIATVFEGHTLKSEIFFRSWWEVPFNEPIGEHAKWKRLYNGGGYQRYSSHLSEVACLGKNYELAKEQSSTVLRNSALQGKGLIGFGKRGEFLDAHVVPNGYVSTVEGKHVVIDDVENAYFILALLNSKFFQFVINLYCGQHKYPGYVNIFPVPKCIKNEHSQEASKAAENIVSLQSKLLSMDETYPGFCEESYKGLFDSNFDKTIEITVREILKEEVALNNAIYSLYSINSTDIQKIEHYCKSTPDQKFWWMQISLCQKERLLQLFMGWVIGHFQRVPKERYNDSNTKLTNDKNQSRELSRLQNTKIEDGILNFDVIEKDMSLLELLSSFVKPFSINHTSVINTTTFETIGDLNSYFSTPGGFFNFHLSAYSVGGREAPIYWPLQTPSGSYTLWVYYHRLNEQTLYTCVNDFVEPKLQQVEQDLNGLRSKSARSTQEEKELEKLSDLASELRDFRDELLRLAKFWKPNLNDGVQITAAPLWKLFQHKAWQKKLKETWESLEKGDYDWAHLACFIWPERVLRKCHQDRSLAIAHDVEDHFWHEVEVPVKRGKKLTGETKLQWQPKDLSDAELSALVKQLAAEVK